MDIYLSFFSVIDLLKTTDAVKKTKNSNMMKILDHLNQRIRSVLYQSSSEQISFMLQLKGEGSMNSTHATALHKNNKIASSETNNITIDKILKRN